MDQMKMFSLLMLQRFLRAQRTKRTILLRILREPLNGLASMNLG